MSTKPEGEIAGFVSGRAERRKSERHAFVRFGQVLWLRKNGEAVTHGKRQTIMVRNYSEHGIGFYSVEPVTVGDRFRLFHDDEVAPFHEGTLEVRHCDTYGPGWAMVGAEFVEEL